jgi:hypothetical protein
MALCAVPVLALLWAAEGRASSTSVSVDMSSLGANAPMVHRDFLGVAIPYYLIPSMLSYSDINVDAHQRFAVAGPAPPAPRNQKMLAMLAAIGHGTLRVGGEAQEQMCYFDQELGKGCSWHSRITTRHYALIKDFLLDLNAGGRAWKVTLGVPLADGGAAVQDIITEGINRGFTGARFPPTSRLNDNRRLISTIAVGHEPNALVRRDYRPRPSLRRTWSAPNGRFRTNQLLRREVRRFLTSRAGGARARYSRWAGSIMAGPGLPTYSDWGGDLGSMIAAGGYKVLTQSVYMGGGRQNCVRDFTAFDQGNAPCWPRPTAGAPVDKRARFLLNEAPLTRLAAFVRKAIRTAGGRDLYGVESNGLSKRGAPGISDTMVNALWGLDWMFAMASQGVRAVNLQHADRWNGNGVVRPGGSGFAPYNAIGLANGALDPRPLYYAMVLFGQFATGTAVGQGHARIEPLQGGGIGSRLRSTTVKGWRVNSGQTNTVFLINKDSAVASDTTDDTILLAPNSPPRECYAIWLRGGESTIKSTDASLGNPLTGQWARVDQSGRIPAWNWQRIEPVGGQYPIPIRRGDAVVVRFW